MMHLVTGSPEESEVTERLINRHVDWGGVRSGQATWPTASQANHPSDVRLQQMVAWRTWRDKGMERNGAPKRSFSRSGRERDKWMTMDGVERGALGFVQTERSID